MFQQTKNLWQLALLATAITTSSAFAAGFEQPAPAAMPSSGWYLGLSAGWPTWLDSTATTTAPYGGIIADAVVDTINASSKQSFNDKSANFGIQGGYNYFYNQYLLGLETDFTGQPIRDSADSAFSTVTPPRNISLTQTVKSHWLYTLRPRVGFMVRDFTFFGTGGLAVGDLKYKSTLLFTNSSTGAFVAQETGNFSKTLAGWTAGGGVEYQTAPNWSVRLQYLYVDLGSDGVRSQNFVLASGATMFAETLMHHSASLKYHTVNLAVNYLFNT